MKVVYCANCEKHTGHKRAVGVGTALGAVVTGGLSLVAVPAYGKRCVICGLTAAQAQSITPAAIALRAQGITSTHGTTVKLVLLGVIAIAACLVYYFIQN